MVPCWSRDGPDGVGMVQAYPQPLPEGTGVNKAMGDGTLCLEAMGYR